MEDMQKKNRQRSLDPGADSGGRKKPDRRRRVWLTAAVSIVLAVLLIAGIGFGIVYYFFNLLGRIDEDPNQEASAVRDPIIHVITPPPQEQEEESSLPPASEDEVEKIEAELLENLKEMEPASDPYATDAFNILLVGVDSRSDSMTRNSDTMILVSIDKNTKYGAMLWTALKTDLPPHPGELTEILGCSSSGKNTHLNMLAGLLTPTDGKVFLDDTDLYTLEDAERSRLRNTVDNGASGLLVTHEREAAAYADRVYRMDGGVLIE